jgi:hypothetical protein
MARDQAGVAAPLRRSATRRRGLRLSAAAMDEAVRRASAGAMEERKGEAGEVEERQILEKQSILDGRESRDHVQICGNSVTVGIQ